jgi:hypothetical protein
MHVNTQMFFPPPSTLSKSDPDKTSGILKLHVKFGLNRSLNVASMQVLTHRKGVLTPGVDPSGQNLPSNMMKLHVKFGSNRFIFQASMPVHTQTNIHIYFEMYRPHRSRARKAGADR